MAPPRSPDDLVTLTRKLNRSMVLRVTCLTKDNGIQHVEVETDKNGRLPDNTEIIIPGDHSTPTSPSHDPRLNWDEHLKHDYRDTRICVRRYSGSLYVEANTKFMAKHNEVVLRIQTQYQSVFIGGGSGGSGGAAFFGGGGGGAGGTGMMIIPEANVAIKSMNFAFNQMLYRKGDERQIWPGVHIA